MSEQKDPTVRINILLPLSLRERFDRWCRYGAKPKTSMNQRLVDLITADVAGKVHVPRTPSRQGMTPRKPRK